MPIDEGGRELIVGGASLDAIRNHARARGMVPLRVDGWRKAARGVTTLDEVLRVTRDEVAG